MNEELILEANKTYVFKNDECRGKYIRSNPCNKGFIVNYYDEGFTIEGVDSDGDGYIGEACVIGSCVGENHLFKLKEPSTQSDNPVETTVINVEEELPVVGYNPLATALHKLSDSYTLFYSYYPDEKFFLVDYKELTYKVGSVEDAAKLEKMIIIGEELFYVE